MTEFERIKTLEACKSPVPETEHLVQHVFRKFAPVATWLLDNGVKFEMGGAPTTKTLLEREPMTDPEDAVCDMPGPIYQLRCLPLPLTWADGDGVEDSVRKVAEAVDDCIVSALIHPFEGARLQAIGTGGCYVNSPRGIAHLSAVLDGRHHLKSAKFHGPYLLLVSDSLWGTPYKPCEAEESRMVLGRRLLELDDVAGVVPTPLLKGGQMVLVQVTPDVLRLVVVQMPVVIPWEGEQRCVCCLVPQIRADTRKNVGIAVR